MTNLAHCPYCSYPVTGEAVTLWDGRAYCRKCVEEVSPELYALASAGSPLCETVQRQDVRALHFLSFIGTRCLIAVLLIVGLPGFLLVFAGKVDIWSLIVLLGSLIGFGAVYFSIQAALGTVVHRWRLPRIVSVENGQFKVVTTKESKCVSLSDCKWYFGDPNVDQLAMFTGLRRGVVIQTPEEQLACGLTPEMLQHWRHFLTLARMPQNPPRGCLRILAVTAAGMMVGVLLGSSIGYVVAIITQTPIWTFALGFMGLFEGPAVALIYFTCTSEGAAAARRRLHPALLGVAFLLIGMQFGSMAGFVGGNWAGMLACGSVNALFGASIGWLCRQKIDAANHEREVAGQLGR